MEIGNAELLYDVIDNLSDEEFSELLDTLDIDEDKVTEVKAETETVDEVETMSSEEEDYGEIRST